MSETAGLIMSGTGAAVSAYGSLQAGKYQQQVANYNASVAEFQAQDAVTRGETAAKRHGGQVRQLVGTQRTNSAAQGQDPNDMDSSAGQIQQDAAYLGKLDEVTIRMNAAREAWGYKVQGNDSRMRGQIAQADARNNAVGTIMGTAGNMYLKKYGWGESASTPTSATKYIGSFTNPYGNVG